MPRTSRLPDRELVELFADDPEGLAIVDAIGATQGDLALAPRRRVSRRAAIVILAAAAVVAVVGLVETSTSRAGLIQRALRAVSTAPVVHFRLVDRMSAGSIVALRTGEVSSVNHVIDEWLPSSPSQPGRWRDSVRGIVIADSRIAPGAGGQNPVGFATEYRASLRAHRARKVAGPSINGRPTVWIALRDSRGAEMRVALDVHSYRPLEVDYPSSGRAFSVQYLGESSRAALRPHLVAHESAGAISSVEQGSPAAADRAGLPRELAGMSLRRVRLMTLRGGGRALEVVYAKEAVKTQLPSHYLRVLVSGRPLATLGWSPWFTVPEDHALVLSGSPRRAFLSTDGRYVALESTTTRAELATALIAIAGDR
jgi:hypothetical protein